MTIDIIVVGAGGHAKVCIELFRASSQNVAYCVGGKDSPEICAGVRVLKGDEHLGLLRSRGYCKVFVAVGSNLLRARLANLAVAQGYELVNALSPSAVVSPSVKLGVGVAIMAGAVINAEAVVEDLAIINTGATVDHDCLIGRAVHVAPQCALAGGVIVGDYSFMGIGSKVVPGVTIGEGATVGAGAVVIDNIEPGMTAVGVPARNINN